MKILVIKHGALGDIVLAFPAFAAIRSAHPGAAITLLTARPFAAFLAASPWFDRIEIDTRAPAWSLLAVLRLRRQLHGFDMVYDLQTSQRSTHYFALAGKPPWSGTASGCTFPHANPRRNFIHTRERLAEQLASAGIPHTPTPDLSWLNADISRFSLPESFALLVPGAAAHRPEKRWPEKNFAALATALPMQSVTVGAAGENFPAIAALNLIGKTTLPELAAITARAKLAIGNDTGPMHLAAALNIPSIVLFSAASDPALTAPRYGQDGGWPIILREAHLFNLPVAQVLAALP